MSAQTLVIFNSFSDTTCLKFKFLYNTGTNRFQSHPLLGENNNFDQENECCISEVVWWYFLGVVDKCKITCDKFIHWHTDCGVVHDRGTACGHAGKRKDQRKCSVPRVLIEGKGRSASCLLCGRRASHIILRCHIVTVTQCLFRAGARQP